MIKSLIKEILCLTPLVFRVKLKFYLRNKYTPNIVSPTTFNEKITYRKMYDDNDLFVLCADKYGVRDYVASKVGEQYLIPLVYHGVDITPDIIKSTFEKHGKCVFKVNHNSGGIFFVRNVDNINLEKLCLDIKKQYVKKYGKYHDEMWYDKIVPTIIAEKLILNKNGSVPEDYKFHIFRSNGDLKIIIQVDYDRFTGHNRTFYNTEGEVLPYVNKYPNKFRPFEDVDRIQQMLPIALKLSEDFDYTRVDLYNVDGKVYFGELTFSHGSGLDNFENYEQDLEWGNFWSGFRKNE